MTGKMIGIKVWLLKKGLTQKMIAEKAGVTSSTIHYFCKGYLNSPRVAEVFLKLGCPKELVERRAA